MLSLKTGQRIKVLIMASKNFISLKLIKSKYTGCSQQNFIMHNIPGGFQQKQKVLKELRTCININGCKNILKFNSGF
jgi:hypothetical protein